jgi:hypothetical protein
LAGISAAQVGKDMPHCSSQARFIRVILLLVSLMNSDIGIVSMISAKTPRYDFA